MFTDHQIDLFAAALHISEFEARDLLTKRIAAEHEKALEENTLRFLANPGRYPLRLDLVHVVAVSDDVPEYVGTTARMMLGPFRDLVIAEDHTAALIENGHRAADVPVQGVCDACQEPLNDVGDCVNPDCEESAEWTGDGE